MTQRATIRVDIALNQSVSHHLSQSKDALALHSVLDLLHGSGENEANVAFHDERTLAANGEEALDLSTALRDIFGNTIAFTGIKALYIAAAEANGDNIEIGGAAANGFVSWVGGTDDVIVLPPGGFLLLGRRDAAGWAVTATTGDQLKIANTDIGDGASYKIVLVGIE